ncbi:MAG: hypothetical protein V4505_25745 [Pseudomonadota bacterium]
MSAQKPTDEKYILRFETPGHRARIKAQAKRDKRTLNKQLLMLIEAGEAVQKGAARTGESVQAA